jgi:replicative DNA helicase
MVPHSPEAELGVLGCLLLAPNDCFPECIEAFKGMEDAFYDLRHQTVFKALLEMHEAQEPIDLITVHHKLHNAQLLQQVGGVAYLSAAIDSVPSAANLSYYLEILREKFLLRRLITACTEILGSVYDHEGEVDEVLDKSESNFMAINQLRLKTATRTTAILVKEAAVRIEAAYKSQGEPSGLRTGFQRLDRMTDGLHGGEMVIIAARPSVGKSSLMMNIVENIVLEQKLPVGVFSLEMSGTALVQRSIGSVGKVNIREPWDFTDADFRAMTLAATKLHTASSRLIIDDTPGLSILELRARARRMVQQHKIKALFIDYLQLLHGTSKKAKDNRQIEISEVSQGIKSLAKELNLPVVALSQLNRDLEKNQRRPRLSDLRESGALEQDADVIGLLSLNIETDVEGVPIPSADGTIQAVLDIAKQRAGPTGEIKLRLRKKFTLFETASEFEPAEDEARCPHNDR